MSRHSHTQPHARRPLGARAHSVLSSRFGLASRFTAGCSSVARRGPGRAFTPLVVLMLAFAGGVAAKENSAGTLPPTSTSPPSISGTEFENETLTADPGDWGGPTFTVDYQWLRCDLEARNCVAIDDATDRYHVLTAADVGFTVRVAVIATNKNGSAVATSDPTAPVASVQASGSATGPATSTADTASALEGSATSLQLMVSTSDARTGAGHLNGQTVKGTVYVFTAEGANVTAPVRFFFDEEPDSTPSQVERNAPFDFKGGNRL
jgi:hypothetical protein